MYTCNTQDMVFCRRGLWKDLLVSAMRPFVMFQTVSRILTQFLLEFGVSENISKRTNQSTNIMNNRRVKHSSSHQRWERSDEQPKDGLRMTQEVCQMEKRLTKNKTKRWIDRIRWSLRSTGRFTKTEIVHVQARKRLAAFNKVSVAIAQEIAVYMVPVGGRVPPLGGPGKPQQPPSWRWPAIYHHPSRSHTLYFSCPLFLPVKYLYSSHMLATMKISCAVRAGHVLPIHYLHGSTGRARG